jgi:2-oxoglutaroyl-CoA hydrolase
VVEDAAALESEIMDMAAKLRAGSPLALRTIKRVLATTYDASLTVGLEIEGHAYEKLRRTDDYREGIKAFAEKRKARFKDTM